MITEKYDKYDIISFDVFDTLIKRNIKNPQDVFKLVEKKYNEINEKKIKLFSDNRIKSEIKCRRKKKEEITLDDIYYEMLSIYSEQELEILKKLEIDTEIKICQKNNDKKVRDIYDWALNNKKVIIIITDIYLPYEVIERILQKNDIKYIKLFVSSKIGLMKKNSSLFKYVLEDLEVDPKKILHIGDNINSDILMSKKVGIDSVQIFDGNKVNKKVYSNITNNIINTFINNNLDIQKNYFYKFGYTCLGPMLFSYVVWLKENFAKKHIKKIFFLARDGKIMKEAFDIISNNEFNTTYMMASRRSIIVPSLWKYNSMIEIISKIKIPDKISMNDLIRRMGLEDFDLEDIKDKYNIDYEEKFEYICMDDKCKKFLKDIFPFVVDNSKKEYNALINYIDFIKFKGNIAIVDIGWFGNIQTALQNLNLENTKIVGFYLGLRPNKKENIENYGYLFDKNKNIDLNEFENSMNAIFEFMFSATHGSVKKFVNTKDYYELYESENLAEYENIALTSLQEGAIDFVNQFNKSNCTDYCDLNAKSAINNLSNILLNPSVEDAIKIGNLRMKDDNFIFIAKGEKFSKYIFKPKKFVIDLKNSTWKIGFMKRVFKINLPYYKIFRFIKKVI